MDFILKTSILGPFLQNGLFYIFVWPFFVFYLHGPNYLGCWEGQPYANICAKLTSSNLGDESFWNSNKENQSVCEGKIIKHFIAQYSVIIIILYAILIYKLLFRLPNWIAKKLTSSKSKKTYHFSKKFKIHNKKSNSPINSPLGSQIKLKSSSSSSKSSS